MSTTTPPPPTPLRDLKAKMAAKGLSLKDVSERSEVDYTSCSRLLNGWLNHPEFLAKITRAIETAPQPKGAAR